MTACWCWRPELSGSLPAPPLSSPTRTQPSPAWPGTPASRSRGQYSEHLSYLQFRWRLVEAVIHIIKYIINYNVEENQPAVFLPPLIFDLNPGLTRPRWYLLPRWRCQTVEYQQWKLLEIMETLSECRRFLITMYNYITS